jgi:hypothetical protein
VFIREGAVGGDDDGSSEPAIKLGQDFKDDPAACGVIQSPRQG